MLIDGLSINNSINLCSINYQNSTENQLKLFDFWEISNELVYINKYLIGIIF